MRLATADYIKKDFTNKYEHLTNYSVNKHNIKQSGDDSTGCSEANTLKLTLHELRERLASQFNEEQINNMYSFSHFIGNPYLLTYSLTHFRWYKIDDLIIKTFISVENKINTAVRLSLPIITYSATTLNNQNNNNNNKSTYYSNCFELFGFDVLIDESLQPHLLEVNFSPSLNTDSPLDFNIKSKVLVDLFNLVGIPNPRITTTTSSSARYIRDIVNELENYDVPFYGEHGRRMVKNHVLECQRMTHDSIGYRRIFPTTTTTKLYKHFFESFSPLNALMGQYLLLHSLKYENKSVTEAINDASTAGRTEAFSSVDDGQNKHVFYSKWMRLAGTNKL